MTRRAASFGQVAVLAASCAVIAGAAEAGILAVRRLVLNRITFFSDDFAWMAPVAYLVAVVPAALLLYGLSVVLRRPLSLPTLLGLLTTSLVFGVFLPFTTIAWWGWAAIGLGAGVRVAQMTAGPTIDRQLFLLRTTAAGLAVLLALLAVTMRAGHARPAQLGPSSSPPATEAPNVLLIVLDTVRSANLSVYGYDRPTTPGLERLARQATVFDRAIATSSWTLPSHASMFTGQSADDSSVSWRAPLPRGATTLAEQLRDAGGATAGFVSNLMYASRESGLERGFSEYDDYQVSWPTILRHASFFRMNAKSALPQARSPGSVWKALIESHIAPDSAMPADVFRPADQVAAQFLEWQAGLGNRRFFAFLNFFDAHGPYRSPDAYVAKFARGKPTGPIDRYDAAIAWLDHVVGQILDSLQQRGVLDRTIVIVTSDHGDHFGEHGLKGHANSLYLPLLHVPLILRYPASVPGGVRVGTLVSLRDVPATILELAGIHGSALPGSSLTSTWKQPGEPIHGDIIASLEQGINVDPSFRNSRGNMVSRLDQRFHYIRDGDGKEELFDYLADPAEQSNLINDPAMAAVLGRLRARLVER